MWECAICIRLSTMLTNPSTVPLGWVSPPWLVWLMITVAFSGFALAVGIRSLLFLYVMGPAIVAVTVVTAILASAIVPRRIESTGDSFTITFAHTSLHLPASAVHLPPWGYAGFGGLITVDLNVPLWWTKPGRTNLLLNRRQYVELSERAVSGPERRPSS
jgi:hypothetical protein